MNKKNLLFNLADELSFLIFKKTLGFDYKYQSSIGDQLRRASLSITLNLVEGGAKSTEKEKNQYRKIAYSSLKETKYLVHFCKRLNLIDEDFYEEIMEKINTLAKLLYGLIRKHSQKQ